MLIWHRRFWQGFSCWRTSFLPQRPNLLAWIGIFQICIFWGDQCWFLSWHSCQKKTTQSSGHVSVSLFLLPFSLLFIVHWAWMGPCRCLVFFWLFWEGGGERNHGSHCLSPVPEVIQVEMRCPCDSQTCWLCLGWWFCIPWWWGTLANLILWTGAVPCVAREDGTWVGEIEYLPFWILHRILAATKIGLQVLNQCQGWTFLEWGSSFLLPCSWNWIGRAVSLGMAIWDSQSIWLLLTGPEARIGCRAWSWMMNVIFGASPGLPLATAHVDRCCLCRWLPCQGWQGGGDLSWQRQGPSCPFDALPWPVQVGDLSRWWHWFLIPLDSANVVEGRWGVKQHLPMAASLTRLSDPACLRISPTTKIKQFQILVTHLTTLSLAPFPRWCSSLGFSAQMILHLQVHSPTIWRIFYPSKTRCYVWGRWGWQ